MAERIRWNSAIREQVYELMFRLLGAEMGEAWRDDGSFQTTEPYVKAFVEAQTRLSLGHVLRRSSISYHESHILIPQAFSKFEENRLAVVDVAQLAAAKAIEPNVTNEINTILVSHTAQLAELVGRLQSADAFILELVDKVDALEHKLAMVSTVAAAPRKRQRRLVVLGSFDHEYAMWEKRLNKANKELDEPFLIKLRQEAKGAATFGTFDVAVAVTARCDHGSYYALKAEAKKQGAVFKHVPGGLSALLATFASL